MLKPYRTVQDVLSSPWAQVQRAKSSSQQTDRVLRSTKLEDSIYRDLRMEDTGMDEIENSAGEKLRSFPALSRDIFQSFYSLMPRRNTEDDLSVAARKINVPILEHITQSEDYAYGVELDESRAEEAQTRLHRVGFGSFFHSSISREAFHLLFLNPPYLSVINESGGRSRHEKRFLIESLPALAYGGLLIYVIPYYRLTPDICRILVDNFDDLSVWRFTESEFRKFKQVAVLGIRKPRGTELQDTLWLEELASAPMSIRSLAEMPEERYALPDHPIEVNTFKGERFNQKELEQQLRRCNSFAQMMARSELDSGVKRPLLPLSISQIGLIGGSGMINGLIACDTPHIIKGRIVKVIRTESEEKFSAQGNHIGSEVKETITNKMIFNVLTPNGFKALT